MAFGDLMLGAENDFFYTYSYVKGAWNSGYSMGSVTRRSSKGIAVSPTHGTIYALNYVGAQDYDEVLPYSRRLYGGRENSPVPVGRRYDPIRLPLGGVSQGEEIATALTVPYRVREDASITTKKQQNFLLGESFIYGDVGEVRLVRSSGGTPSFILERDRSLSYTPQVIGLSATPDGSLYTLWNNQTITYTKHGYDSTGEFSDTAYEINALQSSDRPRAYEAIPLPPHLSSIAGREKTVVCWATFDCV